MAQRIAYQDHAAAGMHALGGVYTYVQRSGLAPTLINLAFLRASQINGCGYCIDMHSRDLLKQGVALEKILLLAVWQEIDDVFDDRERAVLRWAEAVTRVADTHVADEDFEIVRQQLSEKELADLTLAIGVINVYNRMSVAFRRQPEFEAAR
jgi:AhpD family alkylhydroperoxidase